MRRSKIICTLGPASASEAVIRRMIEEGMDIVRLNFSHGTHAQHRETIRRIRKISKSLERPVAVLQDLEGPRVRIGSVKGGTVRLEAGRSFTLTARPMTGDAAGVGINYPDLPELVQPGDPILLNDGTVELQVEKTGKKDIACRVITGGYISSHKGLNLPTRSVTIPAFTEKDRKDLKVGVSAGVDYVAMSFVREASDVDLLKRELSSLKAEIPVIAKIERHEALRNLDAILNAADGAMVARGDLGIEIAIEKVPLAQKTIIRRANLFGKPVVTATQMLRSMVESPHPTRAEVNDVANAVIDGSDALMLSEETAVGAFPVQSVSTMSRIVEATDSELSSRTLALFSPADGYEASGAADATCKAAAGAARSVGARVIVVFTQTGNTARLISRYRPAAPILAFAPDETVRRRMALLWGVLPMRMDPVEEIGRMVTDMEGTLRKGGWVVPGDRFVILFGYPVRRKGFTNMMKIHTAE